MGHIPVPADGGEAAIHAAGKSVNGWDLTTTAQIRRAVPEANRAADAVKMRSESTNWKTGRFTGLAIAIFQNWLYERNREWHFTDGTLCVLWCVEFPDARSDYAEKWHYIASTRGSYNCGRHQADAPAKPCVGYDRNGKPTERESARLVKTISSPPVSTEVGPVFSVTPTFDARLTSDPARTHARVRLLDLYMAGNVLHRREFVCETAEECRRSHHGEFFEGQLHHVGHHYDMTIDGRPFRIAVVGQEYGNGPACVPSERRTFEVTHTGLGKRFRSDGTHEARNPHMRGTTSLLRLLFGRSVGSDHEGEFLNVSGRSVHLFEAFALTNFLLCSAIESGQSDTGSKRGASTSTMQRNCARHFRATMEILEPTVVIAQGRAVRRWLAPVVWKSQPLAPDVERIFIGDHSCLLASFTHPSVPSHDNWGDDRRPYLTAVVAPAISAIHAQMAADA